MTEECLSPVEVNAMRIIAYARQNKTPDNILIGQLFSLAHDCKQQGHEDDYEAILRIIGYIQEDIGR